MCAATINCHNDFVVKNYNIKEQELPQPTKFLHATEIRSNFENHQYNMATEQVTKLRKEQEKTWNFLHKKLIELPSPSQALFAETEWTVFNNKAVVLSSSVGFLVASLITTCAFVAGLQSTTTSYKRNALESLFNIHEFLNSIRNSITGEISFRNFTLVKEIYSMFSLYLHFC